MQRGALQQITDCLAVHPFPNDDDASSVDLPCLPAGC